MVMGRAAVMVAATAHVGNDDVMGVVKSAGRRIEGGEGAGGESAVALLTDARGPTVCCGDGLGGAEGRGIDIGSCDMSWSNVAGGEDEELPHRTMGGHGIGGTVMIVDGPDQLQSGGAAGFGVEDEEQAGATGGGGGRDSWRSATVKTSAKEHNRKVAKAIEKRQRGQCGEHR